MFKHVRRWNEWRKGCLNGPIYKIMVLFGVIESPTMTITLLPEEEKKIIKAFVEGYERGIKHGKRIAITEQYTPNQIREMFGLDPIGGENNGPL